jgi:tetratricopeptide (TPR) repeat protein
LVEIATTPTELETAVGTALRLVARAGKREEIRSSLTEQEDLGVGGRCLLSALYADLGDTIKASEILTQAAATPGGSLARFYRVRFEGNRGNLEEAIKILRGIIETPEGRKTVHFRRLVDLLERTGDYEKALTSVEEWKRIAPGDHAAWTRRARLLQADGQPNEAVVELRRMIGKFGADEERRATLATALIESAEFTAAQRIYEQLYQESEKLESKLKWAGELAQLAEREGKLEELLEDFDRRKRSNPRSVAPLLALAEIHRVLDQYEERRSALLEASRRRPEDTNLLARIAEVEERAGEFDRAVGILRDAVKRDKTPESKRRLASLLLKNGEIQNGLDLLAEIPGTVTDPRGLESIVQALVGAQEFEHALKFLDEHLGGHESDWRLRYLKGVVLKMSGEEEKALETFTALLKGGEEIANLKPLVPANNRNANMGPWRSLFGANGWEELTPYQPYLTGRNFGPGGRTAVARIGLPGTSREVQLLSLLQGSSLLSVIPEKKAEAAGKALSLPGIRDVDILAGLMSGNGEEIMVVLQERVKEQPDNAGLFALSLVFKANMGGITLEEFEKAERILLKDNPETFAMIAFSAIRSTEVTGERMAKTLEKAIKEMARDEVDELMELLTMFSSPMYGAENGEQKDLTALKNLMANYALETTEAPKNWQWMTSTVAHLLAGKRADEALTLINRLCAWQAQMKGPAPATGMMAMMAMSFSSQGGQLLVPPAFPPQKLAGVPLTFLQLFPVKVTKKSEKLDAQAQLRAQLMMETEAPITSDPAEVLGDRIETIANPGLRALALLTAKRMEEAEKLIEAMMESREESALLFAAGYFQDNNDPRAYDALLKVRMLPLSRESRKKVDGHLACLGGEYAGNKDLKIDLEPAKRAALRLRRVISVKERESLGEVLVSLGLKEEAERLASVPTATAPANPFRSGPTNMRKQTDRITELTKEGNIDGASREAAKQFRILMGQQGSEWELEQLVEKMTTDELKEETLKRLDPGETQSAKRLYDYARAQQLIGSEERARELFEEVLKKNPRMVEARVGAIQTTPFDEVKLDDVIIRMDDKIDTDASGIVFDGLWSSSAPDGSWMRYIEFAKLTTTYLETLPPSGEEKYNLSWVPYYILQFSRRISAGSENLTALIEDGRRSGSGAETPLSKTTRKRNEAAKMVFLAMIKHPQIAEQGFMLLESGRKELQLSDEDLAKYAHEALTSWMDKPEASHFPGRRGLWSKHTGNSSSSSGELQGAKGPMTWLMAYSAETGKEMFTPELMKKLAEARPEEFSDLTTARSLAKADPVEGEKIYAAWREKLPAVKRQKALNFARQILLFNPKGGEWVNDLEQLVFPAGQSGMTISGVSTDESRFAAEWGSWRYRSTGTTNYQKFLLRLFETYYGPSEKWPIMAELGEDGLPGNLRSIGYSFDEIPKELLAEPSLAKPTLLFLGKHPLEKFVYNLGESIAAAWAPRYADHETVLASLQKNQLLTVEEGGKIPGPEHVLLVSEGMKKIQLSNGSQEKTKLSELILKTEGFDPILQKVAAASLISPEDSRKIMQPVLEGNIDLVRALVAASPERSFVMLRKWFPEMEESEISPPLKEVFGGFAKAEREKKLNKAREWIERGMPNPEDENDDELWLKVLEIYSLNESLGTKLIIRTLNDIRVAPSGGRSSRNNIYLTRHDRALSSLLKVLKTENSNLELSRKIKLVDAIYRDEVGAFFVEFTAVVSYGEDWVGKAVLSGMGDDKFIPDLIDSLSPAQSSTLAALTSDTLIMAKEDELKKLSTHLELFAKRAPALGDLLDLANHHQASKKEKDVASQSKIRESYLSLLKNENLSLPMKADLLVRLNRKAPYLSASSEAFEVISEILADFGKTERNFAASSLGDLVINLSSLDFPGMEKSAGQVAVQASELLLSKEAAVMRRRQENPPVSSSVIKLALKAGRGDLAGKILRRDYQSYRGKLEILVALARAGDLEAIQKLVAAGSGTYDPEGLGNYDKDFHDLVGKILAEVREENRYHLEVMLSDRRDPPKGKGTPHHTPRGPRMEKLARQFEERGEKLAGDARLQVLATFAYHGASAPLLEKQLRKVSGRLTIVDSLIFEENSSEVLRSDGLEILKRVIKMDMASGNVDPVLKKLTEFQEALASDRNDIWKLRYHVPAIFGLVAQELVRLGARSPQDAEAILPHAKTFFNLAMKLKTREDSVNTFDGAGLIVHALAGKDLEWKAFLDSLPAKEKARYKSLLKKRGRDTPFKSLVNNTWKRTDNSGLRLKIVNALLNSTYYRERDLTYVHDFYGISDTGLATRREVIEAVEALPEDHPLKVEALFHIASLKTYKIEGRTIEKGLAAYTAALDLARKKGDEKKANQILAHRCDVLFRNDWLEKVKSDAALVKVDLLPLRDQTWVKKALPKWLK